MTEEEEPYPLGQYQEAFKRIFQELQKLVAVLNGSLGRISIDSGGRLRVQSYSGAGEGTVYVYHPTGGGAWNLGNFPVDQRWELIQRANMEFDQIQRARMVIT